MVIVTVLAVKTLEFNPSLPKTSVLFLAGLGVVVPSLCFVETPWRLAEAP